MKLKQTLLGIILSFTTAGAVATSVNSDAYQKIYDKQNQQEILVKKALDSEFIATDDKEKLENDLKEFTEAKTSQTKKSLDRLIDQEKENLEKTQTNLTVTESKVAKKELTTLQKNITDIQKKSQESFVLNEDTKNSEDLKSEVAKLTSAEKVKPIRLVATKADDLSKEMSENQATTKKIVEELKGFKKQSEELGKKKYINEGDKKALEKDSKENSHFFKDADNLDTVKKRQEDSKKLITDVDTKQKTTESDFKENEAKSRDLLASSEKLLAEGQLNETESTKLKDQTNKLKSSLELKDYQPGDLGSEYITQKSEFDQQLKVSDQRIEEANKKAEAEAKEQARKEAEAQKKAEAESAGPTLVGEWHQAPPGKKFLKSQSGKTYGQVKNPGNFNLITTEEAANYSPGHGNGSAKQ